MNIQTERNVTRQCYVIMPFSNTTEQHSENYWTRFFNMVQSIMERKFYKCFKSDAGPYMIFEEMIQNIRKSDLVIAVLTDYNPNVWYELGVRHALNNGTILLLQEGQEIPYDLKNCGVNLYQDTDDWTGLEQKIEDLISKYLRAMGPNTIDSPVIQTIRYSDQEQAKNRIDDLEQQLMETQRSNKQFQDMVWSMLKDQRIEKKPQKYHMIYRRVLWVDDFPENNRAYIDLLIAHGVTVHCAVSTQEGMRRLQEDFYDLVITDMGRGEEGDAGLRLIREMREAGITIPAILFSSYRALTMYAQEIENLGVYLATSSAAQLLAALRSILNLDG